MSVVPSSTCRSERASHPTPRSSLRWPDSPRRSRAARWPPVDDPELVQGLPPSPDTSVLALDHDGHPVGAAWWHFREPLLVVTPDGAPVPELVVAVMPADRGRGVGRGRSASARSTDLFDANARPGVTLPPRQVHPRWPSCHPVSPCMEMCCRSCCLLAASAPVDRDHAGARASSRRPGATRPRGGPGAALDTTASRPPPALLPGRRVVAPGEADGMTHPSRRQ